MDDDKQPAQVSAGRDVGVTALPFRAVLTPHRSLSPSGFVILMSALGLVSFALGVAFASIGAWPVFGFFGLDVAIVYLAFKLNYRSGRLYETVEVLPETLTIKRVQPSGEVEVHEFQSYWARVLIGTGAHGRHDLRMTSHGREIAFGHFLTDDERESLANELGTAIQLARQPQPM